MKKGLLLLILFIFANTVYSQDSLKTRKNEYYISLAGIGPVNIHLKYKRQLSKITFLKIGLVNLSGLQTKSSPTQVGFYGSTNTTYSGGLEIGIEFRKSLSKRFTFFNGPNISATYMNNQVKSLDPSLTTTQQTTTNTSIKSCFLYTFGLLFNASDNILLAVEINPSIYQEDQSYKNGLSPNLNSSYSNMGFAFTNGIGSISLVFKP